MNAVARANAPDGPTRAISMAVVSFVAGALAAFLPSARAAPAGPVAPAKPGHALLVLMENGGFTNGMPADATIGMPACGRFRIPSGTKLSELLSSVAAGLQTSASCLQPDNWKTISVPITRYVALITNRVIEDVGVGAIRKRTGDLYDTIVILQDADVTIEHIRSELTALAPRYTVDIHVLAHGAPDAVKFRQRSVRPADIRSLADIPGLHLRSVYQQNCYGSTLADDWLAAGAGAVNASELINYMPFSYLSFLKRWAAGQNFNAAVADASADWVPYFRTVYRYVDLYDGKEARVPADVNVLGRLDPTEELAESRMRVFGPGASVSAIS